LGALRKDSTCKKKRQQDEAEDWKDQKPHCLPANHVHSNLFAKTEPSSESIANLP
jgi:hypothetical protein